MQPKSAWFPVVVAILLLFVLIEIVIGVVGEVLCCMVATVVGRVPGNFGSETRYKIESSLMN
jgi:hypothetical protein